MSPFLSSKEEEAVTAFRERLKEKFGTRIREMKLFGSRARGEGDEDSDVDLLVLMDEAPPSVRGQIFEIAADIFLEHEVDISPLVMSEEDFLDMKKRERLLPLEIEREGRSL